MSSSKHLRRIPKIMSRVSMTERAVLKDRRLFERIHVNSRVQLGYHRFIFAFFDTSYSDVVLVSDEVSHGISNPCWCFYGNFFACLVLVLCSDESCKILYVLGRLSPLWCLRCLLELETVLNIVSSSFCKKLNWKARERCCDNNTQFN